MCSKFCQSGLFTLELPALIAEETIFDLVGMLPFGRFSIVSVFLLYKYVKIPPRVNCFNKWVPVSHKLVQWLLGNSFMRFKTI